MTKKEMKNLAKEVAKYESINQNPESTSAMKKMAKDQILYLMNKVPFEVIIDPEQMDKLDSLIQLYIEK